MPPAKDSPIEVANRQRARATVEIRAVRPSDAEALAAMMSLPGFRRGTLRLPYASPEDARKRIEDKGSDCHWLVALERGELIGTASLYRLQGRRAHVGDLGMGVHDAHHGRGVGSALLSALIDLADNWLGLRRLELTAFADNAPAVGLYRKFGFAVEGTLRDYAFRDGAFADVYAMARLRA